jgi:hypothetical protein
MLSSGLYIGLGRSKVLAGFIALCFYLWTGSFARSNDQRLSGPKLVRNEISKLNMTLDIRSDEYLENSVELLESGFLLESSSIILVAMASVSFKI